MKLKVVAIRDSAMDAFLRPMFVPTIAMGTRLFVDEVNRADSPMFGHPEDYELFELGEFDEESGRFENVSAIRQVARGVDVKEDRS